MNWCTLKLAGTPPSPRANHSVVLIPELEPDHDQSHSDATSRELLVLFGGCSFDEDTEEEVSLSDVHILESGGNGWIDRKIMGSAPEARYSHSAVVVGNSAMYIFGGNNEMGSFNDTFVLSFETMKWAKPRLSTPPDARGGHSACVLQETKMYIFGGEYFQEPLCDMHCLETGSGKWKEIESKGDIPSGRFNHSCTSISNTEMVLFGGFDGESALDDTYLWDSLLEEWELVNTVGAKPEARGNHRAVFFNERLWIFGGVGNEGLLSDLHSLDVMARPMVWYSHSASECGAGPSAREGMSMTVMDNKVYVFAGRDDEGELCDVFTLSDGRQKQSKKSIPISVNVVQPTSEGEGDGESGENGQSVSITSESLAAAEESAKKVEERALEAEKRSDAAVSLSESIGEQVANEQAALERLKAEVDGTEARLVEAKARLVTMESEADKAEAKKQLALGRKVQTQHDIDALQTEIDEAAAVSQQLETTYNAAMEEREELLERLVMEKKGVSDKYDSEISELSGILEDLAKKIGLNSDAVGEISSLVENMNTVRRQIGEAEQQRAELYQGIEEARQDLNANQREHRGQLLEFERLSGEVKVWNEKLEKKSKKKRKVKKDAKEAGEKARRVVLEHASLESAVNIARSSTSTLKTSLEEVVTQLSELKEAATTTRMNRVKLEEDLRSLLSGIKLRNRVCEEARGDLASVMMMVENCITMNRVAVGDLQSLREVSASVVETVEMWPTVSVSSNIK